MGRKVITWCWTWAIRPFLAILGGRFLYALVQGIFHADPGQWLAAAMLSTPSTAWIEIGRWAIFGIPALGLLMAYEKWWRPKHGLIGHAPTVTVGPAQASGSALDQTILLEWAFAQLPTLVPEGGLTWFQLSSEFGGMAPAMMSTSFQPDTPMNWDKNFPKAGYKCTLTNLGTVAVLNAQVTFVVEYLEVVKNENGAQSGGTIKTATFRSPRAPLGVGVRNSITFYLVNLGPTFAQITPSKTVSIQQVGTDKMQTAMLVPLEFSAFAIFPFEPPPPAKKVEHADAGPATHIITDTLVVQAPPPENITLQEAAQIAYRRVTELLNKAGCDVGTVPHASMPIRQGSSCSKNLRICERRNALFTTTSLALLTPWIWKTFLATSRPIVVICIADGSLGSWLLDRFHNLAL